MKEACGKEGGLLQLLLGRWHGVECKYTQGTDLLLILAVPGELGLSGNFHSAAKPATGGGGVSDVVNSGLCVEHGAIAFVR